MRETADALLYWLPRFRRLARQAASRRERIRQTMLFLTCFLGDRWGWRPRRSFVMRGSYGELAVRDYSEMLVILEVLVDESYDDPQLPADPDLILDLGANIGATALWFARRYPQARIVAVEADPATTEVARRNLRGHESIEIVNAAVSDRPGETTLWIARQSWASSTALAAGEGIRVPAVTLDDLIARGGPRKIVKLDVEGAEHAALRACSRLDEIEFITGEYHPVEGASWRQLVSLLDGFTVQPGADARDERRTFTASRVQPPDGGRSIRRSGSAPP